MSQTRWLWFNWLQPVQTNRANYKHFQHFEFVEDASKRPHITESLASLLHTYHTSTQVNRDLLSRLGYPELARVITGDQRPRDRNTRLGNLMEILACELAVQVNNYEIPILRLQYNPNPNQSMKGDDVLGFRFSENSGEPDTILVAESKFRSRYSTSVVDEGYEALKRGFRPYPASLESVATLLSLQGDRRKAERVRQVGRRLAVHEGPSKVQRSYVLFVGTIGQPQEPFKSLGDLGSKILSNLTAVNIVFQKGFTDWVDMVYEHTE